MRGTGTAVGTGFGLRAVGSDTPSETRLMGRTVGVDGVLCAVTSCRCMRVEQSTMSVTASMYESQLETAHRSLRTGKEGRDLGDGVVEVRDEEDRRDAVRERGARDVRYALARDWYGCPR